MRLVLCHCARRGLLDLTRLRQLRAALLAAGHDVLDVADLCAVAARGDSALTTALTAEDVVLGGCHVRALRELVRRLLGHCPPGLRAVDLREPDEAAILAALGPSAATAAAAAEPVLAPAEDAWYPLIDAERCTNCDSCHAFCLFGVYARAADGAVCVQAPLNCKTDCPACARICPANAIIFPKSTDPAINGAVRTAAQLQGARLRLNPQEVFGGDLRAKLAARRAAAATATPLFRPGVFAAPSAAPEAAERTTGGQGQ
jgi:NAD-dependent dihydropyrimidine dehydrogenase PreA subunit